MMNDNNKTCHNCRYLLVTNHGRSWYCDNLEQQDPAEDPDYGCDLWKPKSMYPLEVAATCPVCGYKYAKVGKYQVDCPVCGVD